MTTTDYTTTLNSPNWSQDQHDMSNAIAQFMENPDKQELVIGGYAGSGKTTVISVWIKKSPYRFKVVTPSHKSADVLRRKGIEDVMTLHSFFYEPPRVWWECQRCQTKADQDQEDCMDCGGVVMQQMEFTNTRDLDNADDDRRHRKTYDAVIVDEASMVTVQQAIDMLATGVKLIAIGDPFQLPPVDGDCGFALGEGGADVSLTQVVRNGTGSFIPAYAHSIRWGLDHGRAWRTWRKNSSVFRVRTRDKARHVVSTEAGYDYSTQWIAGRWATCFDVNLELQAMRWGADTRSHEYEGLPHIGDRVLCSSGVNNGKLYEVADLHVPSPRGRSFPITVQPVEAHVLNEKTGHYDEMLGQPWTTRAWKDGFRLDAPHKVIQRKPDNAQLFQLGYAITCHKSQGSEWPRVIVLPEAWIMDGEEYAARWLYTAVTRARNTVVTFRTD